MAQVQGLSLWMAVILLSGQMAGMGVLNLPSSMIGTGLSKGQATDLYSSDIFRSDWVRSHYLLHFERHLCWTKTRPLLDDG